MKSRSIFLGALLVAASAMHSPAPAADLLRLKAPPPLAAPVDPCTVLYCVGFYAGVGVSGVNNGVNVFANGLAGTFNAGGTILDVHVGYRYWNSKFYLGLEGVASYDVALGTSGIGPSFSERFSGMELVKAGGSLSALLGTQPFTFPAALQPYLMSVYAITGGKQRMNRTGIIGGAGAEFVIGSRATIGLEALNIQYGGGGATDVAGLAVSSENLFRLTFNYNFPSGGGFLGL